MAKKAFFLHSSSNWAKDLENMNWLEILSFAGRYAAPIFSWHVFSSVSCATLKKLHFMTVISTFFSL